jgi:hypothetical protein
MDPSTLSDRQQLTGMLVASLQNFNVLLLLIAHKPSLMSLASIPSTRAYLSSGLAVLLSAFQSMYVLNKKYMISKQ